MDTLLRMARIMAIAAFLALVTPLAAHAFATNELSQLCKEAGFESCGNLIEKTPELWENSGFEVCVGVPEQTKEVVWDAVNGPVLEPLGGREIFETLISTIGELNFYVLIADVACEQARGLTVDPTRARETFKRMSEAAGAQPLLEKAWAELEPICINDRAVLCALSAVEVAQYYRGKLRQGGEAIQVFDRMKPIFGTSVPYRVVHAACCSSPQPPACP